MKKIKCWQSKIVGVGDYLFGEEIGWDSGKYKEDAISWVNGARSKFRMKAEQSLRSTVAEITFERLISDVIDFLPEGMKIEMSELKVMSALASRGAMEKQGQTGMVNSVWNYREAKDLVWSDGVRCWYLHSHLSPAPDVYKG